MASSLGFTWRKPRHKSWGLDFQVLGKLFTEMIVSITDLPPEILSCIIQNVRPKSVLCMLALCSRDMHDSVVSHLYRHIELLSFNIKKNPFPLRQLTSLLLKRPDLAQRVRQFTLRGHRDCWHGGVEPRDAAAECIEVDSVFRIAIKASSHSEAEEKQWLMHLSWLEHCDAVLALLLPALVKLEKLDLILTDDLPYFERMIRRASRREKPFDKQPAFQLLKDFMHTYDDYIYGLDPRYISPVMLLPSIRAIYGYRVGSENEEEDDVMRTNLGSMRTPSSLCHLELRGSRLNKADLNLLLQAPKALKTFIYPVTFGDVSICTVNSHDIRDALVPQQDSLENLWLQYDEEQWADDYEEHIFPMRSFNNFTRLKVLRIGALFLLGDSEHFTRCNNHLSRKSRHDLTGVFPETLQTLEVLRCSDHYPQLLQTIEDLVLKQSCQVPNLIHLGIDGPILEIASWGLQIARLADIAHSKGIYLTYRSYSGKAAHPAEQMWGMDGSISWAKCMGWDSPVTPPMLAKFAAIEYFQNLSKFDLHHKILRNILLSTTLMER